MFRNRLTDPTVYGARAKIGVIVPPTNTSNEAEWARMSPKGVTIHSARMPLHASVESQSSLAALYSDIERYAGDLAQASVDVIAYGCTAGSMVSPVDRLGAFMSERTGIPAVTTAQAIVAALNALSVDRISLATPYHKTLNDHEVRFLADHGIEVVREAGFGYGAGGPHEYRNIARVPPAEVYALARSVDRPEAKAILISCTDLATIDAIPQLEKDLGKPVISSNTATFWLALRCAGIQDKLKEFGALLAEN